MVATLDSQIPFIDKIFGRKKVSSGISGDESGVRYGPSLCL
ncbi:28022_t:CDS:1, partial [Dentiscutata erythropus]